MNSQHPKTNYFKRKFQLIKSYCFMVLNNPVFQIPFAIILFIPLLATIGQYLHTGFMLKSIPVPLLFWPGVEKELSPSLPVWLTMGLILISYVSGIVYLVYKKNLGKVIVLGFIVSLVSLALASAVNSVTGWKEAQDVGQMVLAGKANSAIFSLWQNPVWEEIVFRGIPLVILLLIINKTGKRASFWAKAGYLMVPSVLFAFYHVPNHGPARIVDTFILGLAFAWLALEFTFFAPLILHCFFDNNMIQNLGMIESIPKEEIIWLISNHRLLNTVFTITVFLLLAVILTLLIWYIIKRRNRKTERQDT